MQAGLACEDLAITASPRQPPRREPRSPRPLPPLKTTSFRPRSALIPIGVSLFLGAISVSVAGTLIQQIELMIPQSIRPDFERLNQEIRRVDPQLLAAEEAVTLAWRRRTTPDLERSRSIDPDNGLYNYLAILNLLPSKPTGTSQPAESPELSAHLRGLFKAPPVRMYASREWKIAFDLFRPLDESDRAAAWRADVVELNYGFPRRIVLRRLVKNLSKQAEQWRQQGRAADATLADLAVARLLLDTVEDSPQPDSAAMAARFLPAALRAAAQGLPPGDLSKAFDAQATRVDTFRRDWHARSPRDAINLLPATSDTVRARDAQTHVLRSMFAALCGAVTWAGLAVVCIILLPFAIIAWMDPQTIVWRWRGWGRSAAVAIVATPLLLVMMASSFASGEWFTWLASAGTIRTVLLVPLLVPVFVGVATRTCVLLPPEQTRALLPRGAWVVGGALLAITLLLFLFLPLGRRPWDPPAGVQFFRRTALALGGWSLGAFLVWIVWGFIRRERRGVSYWTLAAANLNVAAGSWPIVAVLTLAALCINERNDRLHQQAYAAASAAPLADRLGEDWFETYFKGTRELVTAAATRLDSQQAP